MELKLLYSYEEWLEKDKPRLFKKYDMITPLNTITEEDGKLLALTMRSLSGDLSEEEKDEYESLRRETAEKSRNEKYTDLYYTIADKCLNPQGCKPDFKEIGKLQCELVRMIYPIVVPKKEDNENI